MSPRVGAILALVLVMTIWGTTYIVTKVAVREIPPLTLAALRFFIMAVALLPFAAAAGGLKRLPKPFPMGTLVLMALVGFVLYYGAFNYALAYGSAAQGALIQALLPAAVALGAIIGLKEKPSPRRMLGIALAVGGVVLIVLTGEREAASPNPLLGGIYMFLSVVLWAVYTVLAKRLSAADQTVVLAVVATIGTVLQLPLVLVELDELPSPGEVSPQAWMSVAWLGLAASAFAILVYNRALRVLDASLVGTYINLVPIVGLVSAVLFLGETLHGWQVVGAVLALAGMWLAA